jgi:hypothetical protein
VTPTLRPLAPLRTAVARRHGLRPLATAVLAALLVLPAIGCEGGGTGDSASGDPGSATADDAVSEPVTGDPDAPVSSDDPVASSPGDSATAGDPGSAVGSDDGAPSGGTLYVESLDVVMLESFPVQVRANVAGNLSDGCTRLGEPQVARDGNTFRVALPTTRGDGMCTEALVPFTTRVSLPVRGLAKGTYTVEAGGKTASFTLSSDNG